MRKQIVFVQDRFRKCRTSRMLRSLFMKHTALKELKDLIILYRLKAEAARTSIAKDLILKIMG